MEKRQRGGGAGGKLFSLAPLLPAPLLPAPLLPAPPTPLPPAPTPPSPARLEIADTEKRESRICRTQLLQKSVKA